MVTAIVLVQAERHVIPETAEVLLEVPGVTEVFSVAGEWDLVVVVRVKEQEDLATIVADRMLKMPGIARTQTMIAFKSYSKKDLERVWGIGAD